MKDLGIFVKTAANAVPAVLADHRKPVFLNMALNRGANVAKTLTRRQLLDAKPHALECDFCQPLCLNTGLAHEKHAAGIAVKFVLDDSDIDIDRVTGFQRAVARDAVADDMIDRRANGFGKSAIVKRGGDSALNLGVKTGSASHPFSFPRTSSVMRGWSPAAL